MFEDWMKPMGSFTSYLPDHNYANWYRKTFERPNRNRRKFAKQSRRQNRK